MPQPGDTQALLWLKALKKEMDRVQKNLDYCVRGQAAGRLSQRDFDNFVRRAKRLAKHILVSAEGEEAA